MNKAEFVLCKTDNPWHIRNRGSPPPTIYYNIKRYIMKESKSTIKEDLADIKIVIEIMKKQIAQLEQKLGLVTIRTPLFTEEDLKEMAQMKKK